MFDRPDHSLIQTLLQASQDALRQGQLANALSAAEMAIKAAPNLADAHCQLGIVQLVVGQPERAVACFGQALKLDGRHVFAQASLGQAHLRLGRFTAAREALETAIQHWPESGRAWCDLGIACEQLGDHESAHAAFQRARALLPGDQFCEEAVWRTSTFWWDTPRGRRVHLRRWQPGDEPYLLRCWSDGPFMSRYNLFLAHDQERQQRFLQNLPSAITLSPVLNQSLDWIVLLRDEAVGLLSLTNLNPAERQAEFLIGFPASLPSGVALEASLLAMRYAFRVAGLRKLLSAVYQHNPEAQSNTLHLGFRQEGLWQGGMRHPGTGQPLDLFLNGLTLAEYLDNPQLQRLTERMLPKAG